MIHRSSFLALAAAALVAPRPLEAATPLPRATLPPVPRGPAADAAVAYATALGSGDYAKAYGMLTRAVQRYFASTSNYASVWQADRFAATGIRPINQLTQKGVTIVILHEDVSYFNHGEQAQKKAQLLIPLAEARESGAIRIDDEGHPYRALAVTNASATESGATVTVRKLAFYLHRLELTVSFENRGSDFMTFLPYGRTLLRDESGVYPLWQTRDWTLTDRQLFLGLRLAPQSHYTGALNFQVRRRLDDRARSFSLRIAPALPEGADHPVEFALPPIAVPAP